MREWCLQPVGKVHYILPRYFIFSWIIHNTPWIDAAATLHSDSYYNLCFESRASNPSLRRDRQLCGSKVRWYHTAFMSTLTNTAFWRECGASGLSRPYRENGPLFSLLHIGQLLFLLYQNFQTNENSFAADIKSNPSNNNTKQHSANCWGWILIHLHTVSFIVYSSKVVSDSSPIPPWL